MTVHRSFAPLVIALLLVGCDGGAIDDAMGAQRGTKAGQLRRSAMAIALLETNVLVFYSRDGGVLTKISLRRPAREGVGGSYLAYDARRTEIVALAHGETRDSIVAVDLKRGRVTRRLSLPRGIQFRGLDISPNGRVVLGGNAVSGKKTLDGVDAQRAVLALVDSRFRRARVMKLRSVEDPPGKFGYPDWQVADVGIAADESFAVVTYHGVNTTGADIVTLGDQETVRCSGGNDTSGCIAIVHGAVEMVPDGFIATLGTPPRLGSFDVRGEPRAIWDVGLPGAHITEFALYRNSAITLERCAKGGGMSEVRTSDGRVRVLHAAAVPPGAVLIPPKAVCGERIAVGRDLIVVAKRGLPRGPRGLMFLQRNGRVVNQIAPPAAPLDVLVLR
jgi:hypothetical protein